MSAGSPKFTVSRIAALSLVSLWLAGCTSSSNPPAPVTSVDSGSSSNTNSGMLITPPPKMGATTQQTPQQAPQIQPVQRPVTAPTVSTTEPNASSTSTSAPISAWRWPTDGKVIENFGASEGGNKGIDIAGSKGQAIVATADGRVVYAGNALRGYGNLIIIKHNDDYLSAYAHNDTMLVREQQEVKAGQKIATMGSTGTSSTRLHFEIRYKGKSVNPLRYLPQR
ncbi:TPA: murein hydrolase activator NlpD [Salmonella enterica subsp. enterica serovar Paratyphi B]|nr:murein hydrolase activator NlpD [Salmonella enterica subsp. enterica serovar Heidelberg]HCM9079347.1 murein hydrolase activator NlpD [Salmonella enterica subsp. enterica serovar Paratyphi B]